MASIRHSRCGWQAIIRRKGHKTLSKVFPKKIQAVRWAHRIESDVAELRVNAVACNTTVHTLLNDYQKKFTHRKLSANREVSRIKLITSQLGAVALADLSAEQVIDYVDDRLKYVTSDTVRKELSTLKVAIDAGMALWGIQLPANPVTTAQGILKVTKTLEPGVRRDRRPTVLELQTLYRSHLGLLIEFAVETAMRRGELANQKREHRHRNLLKIPQTKTGRPRTIPLSARAMAILATQPAHINGSIWNMRPDSITQAFTRVCQRAGIGMLRFHDLRHEATSRLFEKGLNTAEVRAITGHSLQSLQRYTHLSPHELAKKLL